MRHSRSTSGSNCGVVDVDTMDELEKRMMVAEREAWRITVEVVRITKIQVNPLKKIKDWITTTREVCHYL